MTESKDILEDATSRMDKAISHLRDELRGIRTGRATPALVENIRVDYYGSPTPLMQLAQISIPEARQILVKPFDTGAIGEIERAILKSDLGMTPQNDGKALRLSLPPLSEDQRKKLAHRVKDLCEQSRVSIRNVRRDANKQIDSAQKDGAFSEDQGHDMHEELQSLLKKHEQGIDEIAKQKTDEIMTV